MYHLKPWYFLWLLVSIFQTKKTSKQRQQGSARVASNTWGWVANTAHCFFVTTSVGWIQELPHWPIHLERQSTCCKKNNKELSHLAYSGPVQWRWLPLILWLWPSCQTATLPGELPSSPEAKEQAGTAVTNQTRDFPWKSALYLTCSVVNSSISIPSLTKRLSTKRYLCPLPKTCKRLTPLQGQSQWFTLS